MVAVSCLDHIIDFDIPVKKPGMCIGVLVLPVEEITASTLRVEVPKHNAQAIFSKEAGQVDGSCCFSNTTFDIINSNFFHQNKTSYKTLIARGFERIFMC